MIYIICDMNCNNFGNYFKIVGLEDEIKQDKNGYYVPSKGEHYPKRWCYKAKINRVFWEREKDNLLIRYSEAIDILFPFEYTRWIKDRFCCRFLQEIYDELETREHRKTDYMSRMDIMVILDILLHSVEKTNTEKS